MTIRRTRRVTTVPADNLKILALDALQRYSALGLVQKGDTRFGEIIARLSQDEGDDAS